MTETSVVLSNGSIAYVIYVNSVGYLETLYFGKSLKKDEYAAIRGNAVFTYFDVNSNSEVPYGAGVHPSTPLELSTHAYWDKTESAIVLRKADGSYETDFRYVSHKVYRGIHPLSGLPHAHGKACQTAEFLLKDTVADIYVKLFVTLFDDKDIVVKSYEIENKSADTVKILRAGSMQLGLRSADYTLTHFYGDWASERQMCENALCDGTFEVASNFGVSSHQENPFMYLRRNTATFDSGEVIGFNLIYSGNHKFRVNVGRYRNARICYGINDEDFEWILQPQQRFVTPQAVVSYSYTGIDKMSDNFHRFIRENLITYSHDKEYKPILFNSWEGCYFDFNTESIISYIDDACKIGTELFVLDDGWFSTRNNDTSGLGDWWVNRDKIDLHKVIAHCRKRGLKFGIWFEPEMVNYNSELYRNHSEYALRNSSGSERSLHRHQFVLDFSSGEVVENIYNQMKAFLTEYHVDYIKWDFNRIVSEHFAPHLGERQGEVYHRLVLGYYSLISRLTAEYPDIMIEGCCGGGGRFDMGTLYYAPQIWTSDESNPARRLFINFSTSLGYPLSCISTHVNDSSIASYKAKAVFALFGTYGYEMNPNKLTDEQKAELAEVAEIYKKYHKNVIENGTLYHLASPYDSNNMMLQCVSADKRQSLILFTTTRAEREKFRLMPLKGLDANKQYAFTDGRTFSGEYLMIVGVDLSYWALSEHEFILLILEQV